MYDYDVIVAGGSLAGSAAAQLLLSESPELRILVLERSAVFSRRVGESTVEASSHFLTRELGLSGYLNEHHIIKQGLRFWFIADPADSAADCSEIGPPYHSRLPGFQVDRSKLDEELLDRVTKAGAEVLREVEIAEVSIEDPDRVELTYRLGVDERRVSARWLVDASGRSGLLREPNGWTEVNHRHPTATIWARWRGCRSLDDALLSEEGGWAGSCHGTRWTATNHYIGFGWWAWCIPLKGGDVSIGVVYDTSLVEPPEGLGPTERLQWFLQQHPVASAVIADAEPVEGDVHAAQQLAFRSTTVAGANFALVGDSAGFIDPFYSPGMDWIAFTVKSAVARIIQERSGAVETAAEIAQVNADFAICYQRWFEAVYEGKYAYMGDYELMRLAFQLDLALYYIGVVRRIYLTANGYCNPPFSVRGAVVPYRLMRAYNRNLRQIALERRARGEWGRSNRHKRFAFNSFSFNAELYLRALGLTVHWLALAAWEGVCARLRGRRPKGKSPTLSSELLPT